MPTPQDEIQSGHEEEIVNNDTEASQETESSSNDTASSNSQESNSGVSKRAEERAKRRESRNASEQDYKQQLAMLMKEKENQRSFYDRQFNELRSQQQELLKHKELLAQIADLKKKSDLEQLKSSNPDEYQKRLMQDMIDEKLKAQTSAINEANPQMNIAPEQLNQMANEATKVLLADPEIGEQRYKVMEPVMREILASAHPSNIPIALANPRELFWMAVGKQFMTEAAKGVQKQQQGVQQANKFHAGTAKPVSTAKQASGSFDNMSDKQLEELKNAEILRQYNLNR